jgi:hypothetical protein
MGYVRVMKKIILIIALGLSPAMAQEADTDKGLSLLQEGAGILLRGMMSDMEPAMQDMAESFAKAEPMLRDLMAMMDDLTNYHAPEVLPNGDILIRRKLAVELEQPEIEL